MGAEELEERARERFGANRGNGEAPNEGADLLAHAFWIADARPQTNLLSVVKGIVGKGQILVMWGRPGSGKTFVMLELTCAVGSGSKWRGRRVRKGIVLYVAAESSRNYLENRIAALKQEWPAALKAEVLMVPLALDLLHEQRGDVDRVITTANLIAKQIGEVVLIVVDTLATTFGGGNENAIEDMSLYVANVQRIRQETGAAVAIVHHGGKDEAKGMRGHSALLAAIDAELVVEVTQDGSRILRTGKIRDGDGYADLFAFRLRVVDLGVDADGDPVRSCVIEGLDPEGLAKARRSTQAKGLGRSQRAIIDVLEAKGPMPRPELVRVLQADYSMSKSAAQHAISGLLERTAVRSLNGLVSLE